MEDAAPAAASGRPIRVLEYAAIDGSLTFVLPMSRALKADGFDVLSAAQKSDYGPDHAVSGIPWIDLPVPRQLRPLAILKAIWLTVMLLRRHAVDIVHVHTFSAGIIGRVAGWLARTPIIVYSAHGWLYTPHTPRWKKRLIVLIERIFSLITDFFFVISQEEMDMGVRDRIFGPRGRCLTLGIGIDTDTFDPANVSSDVRMALRRELGIGPQDRVIGYVGRIVAEKGLLELGRAFGALHKADPRVRLLIVGTAGASERDTTCQRHLDEQLAADGCKDAVIFAGWRKDIRELLAICDIFALPSYREGMPVSLLEAMSMALPCVATLIPGCREEVVDGVTGYLIPAQQWEPLARRLGDLLGDPRLATEMGTAGRQRVAALFSRTKVLDVQVSAYRFFREQLLGQAEGPYGKVFGRRPIGRRGRLPARNPLYPR